MLLASHSNALALNLVETIRVHGTSGLYGNFGISIAMSSDTIYVGDSVKDEVFEFQLTKGSWELTGIIEAPEGVRGFGRALALDGETLVIGAYDRISTDEGYVYSYHRAGGLDLIATSDDRMVVGFAVAADAGRIAYSRRQRNASERQAGDVVVRTNGSETIYRSEAHPTYFGMRIDLAQDHLLAMAPTLGDRGGVFLFDLQGGPTRQLALPDEAGRASRRHPVAFVGDACLMAGAGNRTRTQSVIWRGCKADQVEIIDGTGEVSASSGRIAFSGNPSRAQFELPSPFEVLIADLEHPEAEPVRVESREIENSILRNVALFQNRLAVTFIELDETKIDGTTGLQIYELD